MSRLKVELGRQKREALKARERVAWSVEADVCGNSTQKWPDETGEH